MPKGRALRVAEAMRKEISGLLARGLKDPRVGFVSIMGVKMSPDLRYANVYVSLMGSEQEQKSSLIGLRNSAGWIRRECGKKVRLRYTPEIRFFEDESLDQAQHLDEILHAIHEEQRRAPMLKLDLAGVIEELQNAHSFLITSHVSPDGDAVGSMLSLVALLKALGKERISCALADPVPEVYRDLRGAKRILHVPGAEKPSFEVAVIIDTHSRERIGAVAEWIVPETRIVVIDHHLVEALEATVGFIDPSYAAAGEIVADLFDTAGLALDAQTAECIYVAQITDTGAYRYSNTNVRSHRIAAKLVETGLDVASISREVLDVISVPKFRLLQRTLDRMEFRADSKIAYSYVGAADLKAVEATKDDLNGLVNYAGNIEGVLVGALFNAVSETTTKVSLRSRHEFNSAAFLGQFGGGGHAAAAGVTLELPLASAMETLLPALETALGESS